MRLGCTLLAPQSLAELEAMCETFDIYGLSAILAPKTLADFTEDEAHTYGERARALGLVIGETGLWENFLTDDADLRADRIARFRRLLRNADIAGIRSANTLVGTKHVSDRPLFPHAYNFTRECRAEFREVVLRILDGLDLKTVKYGIEPWFTTFFYQPEDIKEFIVSVGHPRFGVHMDQANMISHPYFFRTTELIDKTFALLADDVVSVHVKDLQWEGAHFGLRWNEVYIGEGTMDLATYLRHVSRLDPDMTCYCEHFAEERDYAVNFARLHHIARGAGTSFLPRKPAA
ncbi:MAG: TIM barrel protein [Rhizobiales bacterium]|nr:TIM barrel protein [Hyphomicrobiales bacterium]